MAKTRTPAKHTVRATLEITTSLPQTGILSVKITPTDHDCSPLSCKGDAAYVSGFILGALGFMID